MADLDTGKYPVNSRGFTVIPCIALSSETMEDWMVGFKVTVGLSETGTPTQTGTIEGFDETHLKVRIGSGKPKRMAYDPGDIQLQCYQFDRRILFSNETVERPKDNHPDR